MDFIGKRAANPSVFLRCLCAAIVLMVSSILAPEVKADPFEGPNFKKGLWHFVRTLDMVAFHKTKHRLLEREMTACVDPTDSMRATFASPSIGNCVSAKPEKTDNKYVFSNRCDYMGPVSTTITVYSDESYTEINELSKGMLPRVEQVVAQRVGDCKDSAQKGDGSPTQSH
jgi:hypothetical protein